MKRATIFLSLLLFGVLPDKIFSGKLKVNADKIVNDKGQTVVLKGVNMSGLEWHFKPWFGDATIKYLANTWKANVIRFPLNAQWYIDNKNKEEKPYRTVVKDITTICAKYGMWAILDLHWQNEQIEQASIDKNVAIQFWKLIATDFKNVDNVLYDLYNEPKDNWGTWSNWKPAAESYISAIKAIDPSAIYIVGGADWGYNLNDAVSNPVNNPNVIYSSHHYPWKGGATNGAYQGIIGKHPLLIGEFGYWNCSGKKSPGDPAGDASWVNQLLGFINQHSTNISYTAWNYDTIGNCPYMLTTNRNPYTRSPFGTQVFNDISSKNLVRFTSVSVTGKKESMPFLSFHTIRYDGQKYVIAHLPSNSDWEYSLCTISGRIIQSTKIKANGPTKFRVPVNLSNGIYFIEIKSKTGEQIIGNLVLHH